MVQQLKFSGYGNVQKSNSEFLIYNKTSNFDLSNYTKKSICIRGSGSAYGDAATNKDGILLLTNNLNIIKSFDDKTGIITIESGVTIGQCSKFLDDFQWSLPVVPGSRYITVGGCLASDVHGKNHKENGSFSDHVTSFKMVLANGKLIDVNRASYPDLFLATAGGMGLTGLIIEITIQLLAVQCKKFITNIETARSFEESVEILINSSCNNSHNLAWLDFNIKKEFGRGVIYGSKACVKKCEKTPSDNFKRQLSIPKIPFSLVTKNTSRILNEYKFRSEKRAEHIDFKVTTKNSYISTLHSLSYHKTLFPSDIFKNWNNIFGRNGMVEFQFIFSPNEQVKALSIVSKLCNQTTPVLSAMKVFGESNENYLSFPRPGLVLAVMFPWQNRLLGLMSDLDEELSELKGRKYLSKDIFTRPKIIRSMYPKFDNFLTVKRYYDPTETWQSDLYRRLIS